jgi:hypothetical protein
MEEGESLVGVTVVVVVVLLLLLSHESLAEETTTTTTTLPNYQPFSLLFFSFFLFFLGLCSPIFHRQTQKLMQISTLHNFPETNPTYANFKTSQSSTDLNPKLNANFKNCTICHRQTQKLMQIFKLHNLPQINPKLSANFKNCTICHRQTQKLMQISELQNLPQTNPKLMQISKLIFRQREKLLQLE